MDYQKEDTKHQAGSIFQPQQPKPAAQILNSVLSMSLMLRPPENTKFSSVLLHQPKASPEFILNWVRLARTEHLNESEWFWNYLNNDNPDAPLVFDLTAGENVLQIFHREPDVRLDKMIITNNPVLKNKDI